MLKISDLEEKKLIVAYSMARTSKHIGLENVWRQWCIWWRDDFSVNGGALRTNLLLKYMDLYRDICYFELAQTLIV